MKKHQNATNYRFVLRNSIISDQLMPGEQFLISSQQEEEIFNQLVRVFRCQSGQKVTLINPSHQQGSTQVFQFQITLTDKRNIHLQLIEKNTQKDTFEYQLDLAFGLPNKPAKLEFIIQKATELTSSYIHLVKMDRSQLAHDLKLDRLNKILIEAAEQTERVSLPKLILHNSTKEFLQYIKQNSNLNNLLVAQERTAEITESLLTIKLPVSPTVFIGPEGGFSETEIEIIKEQGISRFNLGGSILRMDTAIILALGVVSQRLSSN